MHMICGEALFDVFFEAKQNDTQTLPMSAHVGGSPLNVAVGLSRLGQSSALFAGIADDMLGQHLQQHLLNEGVNTDYLSLKQAPTTLSFIQNNPNGVPAYTFYGEAAADRQLQTHDLPEKMPPLASIHTGSYSLVVEPTAECLYQLMQRHAGQALISLDPNIRPNIEPDKQRWRDQVMRFTDLADLVKVSDEDLAWLYPDKTPESILLDWLEKGVKLAVLTRGEHGATLFSQQAEVSLPSLKVEVIDTVGAGDTFQAALLSKVDQLKQNNQDWASLLDEQQLHGIGHYAATAAAITCSRQGANMPTHTEVLERL